jgi:putative ABC transport system substrate-binding protein
MRRREFIAGLGSAVAWPLAVRAQQAANPVVGYVGAVSPEAGAATVAAFRSGLLEAGYVEGRNVAVEYRWPDNQYDRLPALIDDLVGRQVAAIVVMTTVGAMAVKAATKSIPVVFLVGTDPVEIGLVASLSRPGGNLTGVSSLSATVAAKRIELLHELVPAATSVALLVNPTNPLVAESETRELQAAAHTLGIRVAMLRASRESELDAAFDTLVGEQAGGLVVSADPLFNNEPFQVVALAARHKVPTIYDRGTATLAGGLISYGTDFPDAWRQTGIYVGRILKGEKPADLPVQQVTKVRLSINLRTAKALGLTIPLPLLGRADEVIE